MLKTFLILFTRGSVHKVGALAGFLGATGYGPGPPPFPQWLPFPQPALSPPPGQTPGRTQVEGTVFILYFYYIKYFLCSSEKYQLLYLKENCILLTLIINFNPSLLYSYSYMSHKNLKLKCQK